MTKFMPFVYDDKNHLTNQKCFIITGHHIAYLTAFFNSSLFKFCFRESFPELQGGTREMSKIFFDKIPVLKITSDVDREFQQLIEKIQTEYSQLVVGEIDQKIYDVYNLTKDERNLIGFIEIQ